MGRRIRHTTGWLAGFVLILAGVGPASAQTAERERFEVAGWTGTAWFAGDTYSHCTIASEYEDRTLLLFGLADGGYSLVLVNPEWRLQEEVSYPVLLSVDQRWRLEAEAFGYRENGLDGIILDLGFNSAAVDALKYGNVLVVEAERGTLSYELTGTLKGLAALEECQDRYSAAAHGEAATNPFGDGRSASNPFAPSGEKGASAPYLLSRYKLGTPHLPLDAYDSLVALASGGTASAWEADNDLPEAHYLSTDDAGTWVALYREEETAGRGADQVFGDVVSLLREGCRETFVASKVTSDVVESFDVRQGFAACQEQGERFFFAVSVFNYATVASVHITMNMDEDLDPAKTFDKEFGLVMRTALREIFAEEAPR